MAIKNITSYMKLAVLIGLGLTNSVFAQFQGDMFFEVPSISATTGQTATFNVAAFSGGAVLGAAHFEINFDPTKLSVQNVNPGTAPEFANAFTQKVNAGTISVVAVNDDSKLQPFGTINLASVEFTVLAAAGEVVPVNITVKSLIDANSSEFSNNGFNGEVVVPSSRIQSSDSTRVSISKDTDMIISRDTELGRRAAEMRPIGEQVILQTDQGPKAVYVKGAANTN